MNDQLHERPGHEGTNPDDQRAAARAALQEADRLTLDNRGDRKVHALATVGFAAVVAAFIALSHLLDAHSPSSTVVNVVYVLALFGVAAWQTRAARTWPAGAKRLSSIGVGVSLIVALGGNMWLNYLGRDGVVPWGPIALVMLAALVPALIAAYLIVRGRK